MRLFSNPSFTPVNEQPRKLQVPEENPGFDEDLELPLDTEEDFAIPDEEQRVIDVPS
jgi:hypothetical protein